MSFYAMMQGVGNDAFSTSRAAVWINAQNYASVA